jgi:predicted MFS family arabinose efflux permease
MTKPLKQVERTVEQLGDDNFIRIEPNNTRWLQLFNLCWMMFMSTIAWVCMAPVGKQVAHFYGQSLSLVNLMPAMMSLVQMLFSIPVTCLIESKGSSWVIMITSILASTGFLLKAAINQSFYLCILGQALISIQA